MEHFLFEIANNEDITFIATIISILLWFVLSISSYLVSTSIPNTNVLSLQWRKKSIHIIHSLSTLIEIKEKMSNKLPFFYIIIWISIFWLIILKNYCTLIIFWLVSIYIFVYCLYKINKIINISIKISKDSKDILMEDFKINLENGEDD